MKTILVSGSSGIVGYGILRSLQMSRMSLSLIGTTIYDDSVAAGFCDVFEKAPLTSDPKYIEWLVDTINKHQVDLVIPGIEADVYKWVDHISVLESTGSAILLNDVDLIHLCKDKWKFYERLTAVELPCAIDSTLETDFDVLEGRFGLPFLLKPRRGFASKGIVRINDYNTFSKHQKNIGEILMAQPIVGHDDEEYTTSAFCDGAGGFSACMTLRRKLSKDGFTEKAEVVDSTEFVKTISDLCGIFHPIGPTNFQFRKCSEGVKLLEINPRVSSSTSIRAAFGYNESAMAVDCFLKHKLITQPEIKRGKAVRYTEEYIFYEDSTNF